jgi:hypothetical protein
VVLEKPVTHGGRGRRGALLLGRDERLDVLAVEVSGCGGHPHVDQEGWKSAPSSVWTRIAAASGRGQQGSGNPLGSLRLVVSIGSRHTLGRMRCDRYAMPKVSADEHETAGQTT